MAYDTNTDYTALKKTLQSQLDATTDPNLRAQLQSQIDAADKSRVEKISSNLTKYGKYATDSELDAAAGLQATNSVGTGFDIQKQNAQTQYAQAKQSASNQALSRGMARSSYVQDRMANLDTEQANTISNIDQAKNMAIQDRKMSILNNYQTNAANALQQEKQDFRNDILAYYGDYQAKINEVQNDGDPSNDWMVQPLQAARQEKLLAQQQAALNGSGGGGGGSGSQRTTLTYAQLNSAMNNIYDMNTDPITGELSARGRQLLVDYATQNGGGYTQQLLAPYGLQPNYRNSNAGTLFSTDEYNNFAGTLGMYRSKNGQATAIKDAYDEGKITEKQAKELLKRYGIEY
jgi:hypothetical protein